MRDGPAGPEPLDAPVFARHGVVPSVLLGAGIGLGVAVAAAAVVFSVIAVPVYLLSSEPGAGLDRALVRRGLLAVAVPVGVVAGVVVGAWVGTWFARGRGPGLDREHLDDSVRQADRATGVRR